MNYDYEYVKNKIPYLHLPEYAAYCRRIAGMLNSGHISPELHNKCHWEAFINLQNTMLGRW